MIEVEEGLVVALRFGSNWDITDCYSPSCPCDHLIIRDGDGTTLVEKTCGTRPPRSVTSKTNRVEIYFETIFSTSVWRLTWSAETPGEKATPDYPPTVSAVVLNNI